MNIFVLSQMARRAARYHCDKHVVKMILEAAQMLYTAWWLAEPSGSWREGMEALVRTHEVAGLHAARGKEIKTGAYKPTHANHPCAIWVRASKANYLWLVELMEALCEEKRARYPKVLPHVCEAHLAGLRRAPPSLADGPRTPFPVAINNAAIKARSPGAGKDDEETVRAYRDYYITEKAGFAKWKDVRGRAQGPPAWFLNGSAQAAPQPV